MKYTELARKAVEEYIKEGKRIEPPEVIGRKAGIFVTIEKEGEFRACIGTFFPSKEDVSKEIINNSIAAATQDYRLGPITEDELPLLSYTVYVLDEPELAKSVEDLDPQKYGVVVKGNFAKIGLLLPGLKEVDTVNDQILLACQKGGINPEIEDFLIYRFQAEKYED
jgi:AmmeMemoRadiSam system protein A